MGKHHKREQEESKRALVKSSRRRAGGERGARRLALLLRIHGKPHESGSTEMWRISHPNWAELPNLGLGALPNSGVRFFTFRCFPIRVASRVYAAGEQGALLLALLLLSSCCSLPRRACSPPALACGASPFVWLPDSCGFPFRGFPIRGFPIRGFPIRGFPIRVASRFVWLPDSWLPDSWLPDSWLPDSCGFPIRVASRSVCLPDSCDCIGMMASRFVWLNEVEWIHHHPSNLNFRCPDRPTNLHKKSTNFQQIFNVLYYYSTSFQKNQRIFNKSAIFLNIFQQIFTKSSTNSQQIFNISQYFSTNF